MPYSIGETTAVPVDVGAAELFDNSASLFPMTYRVSADVAVHILIGASPEATTSNFYLPSGTEIVFSVPVGSDISLLGADQGVAYVTEVKQIAGRRRRTSHEVPRAGASAPVLPVNLVLPSISGNTTFGATLTVSNGTWTGPPDTYTYQWERDGSEIVGETDQTYEVVDADEGNDITCVVTATNIVGAVEAESAAVTIEAEPGNTVIPSISGTADVGEQLTATNGTWNNNPDTYAYQWTRDGVDIGGATANPYTLVTADAGTLIRVRVTATNEAGSTSSTSNPTATVTQDPTNTVAPTIEGDGSDFEEYETHTLTANPGTWVGYPTPTITYQWTRDGSDIGGATASTYELVAADVGALIRVRVIATNAGGSDNETTAPTAAIVAVEAPDEEQDGGDQSSPGVTSDTVTMPGSVTVNGQIFVSFAIYQGSGARSVTSITDNKSNTYTQVGAYEYSTTGARVEIWTAKAVTGGSSFEITVNYSGATYAAWGALETSEVNTSAINVIKQTSGTADPAAFTTDAVGASAKALLIGAFAISGGGANAGIVTPSGWNEFHVFQNFSAVMAGQGASKPVSSKAAVAVSWDHNVAGGVGWAALVISVRRAEAAHYPTVRNSLSSVEVLTSDEPVVRNTLSSVEVLNTGVPTVRATLVPVEVLFTP